MTESSDRISATSRPHDGGSRSLSLLFRQSLRDPDVDVRGMVDNEDLYALSRAGSSADAEVHHGVLRRLAHTPEASAVLGIARALEPWSQALASDLQRASAAAPRWTTPRRWVPLAAAASLAALLFALSPRSVPEMTESAAAQSATVSAPATEAGPMVADSLFVAPDSGALRVNQTTPVALFGDGIES